VNAAAYTVTNAADGLTALVVAGHAPHTWNVILRDDDAQQIVATAFVGYTSIDVAIAKAQQIVNVTTGPRPVAEEKE